jgi:hypothetical protein
MKDPAQKKMITFRPMPGDTENIAKLVIKFGGVSESEAIRIAICEAANDARRPAIYPQLPPIEDVEVVVAAIKRAVRLFEDNRRNFWPEHHPGESAQRTAAVKKARLDSEAAAKELRPQLDSIRCLLAVLSRARHLDGGNLKAVMFGAKALKKSQLIFLDRSRDEKETEAVRKGGEVGYKTYAPLLDLLNMAGLTGPPEASEGGSPRV